LEVQVSIDPITPLKVGQGIESASGLSSRSAARQVTDTFGQLLDDLNQSQQGSDTLMQKLAAGENVDLHQVMVAAEQADISMRVALAMSQKLLMAYQEIMRVTA
jgi:flagellar hook-basal body complex protein FliE